MFFFSIADSSSYVYKNDYNYSVSTDSREAFWHEYAKIPRASRKNPIAEGDFYWIFARNCEGTEQLRTIVLSLRLL